MNKWLKNKLWESSESGVKLYFLSARYEQSKDQPPAILDSHFRLDGICLF